MLICSRQTLYDSFRGTQWEPVKSTVSEGKSWNGKNSGRCISANCRPTLKQSYRCFLCSSSRCLETPARRNHEKYGRVRLRNDITTADTVGLGPPDIVQNLHAGIPHLLLRIWDGG